MAVYNKFDQFSEDLAGKVHDLTTGTTDVYKAMLTLTAPVAGNSVLADLTEIAAGDGYTAGGNTLTLVSGDQVAGVFTFILNDPTQWAATAGTFAPFRYVVIYNDTPTTPLKPLIAFYDRGSTLQLGAGEKFDLDLSQTNGLFNISVA